MVLYCPRHPSFLYQCPHHYRYMQVWKHLAGRRSVFEGCCKELADQIKLGDRAEHVSRAREINSCVGCGENGDQKWCHICELSWSRDCAEGTFDLGESFLQALQL